MTTLTAFFYLHSYSQLSTSLLSVLPAGDTKDMLQNFNQTQNSKVLLLSIKGFDKKALKKMQNIEDQLKALPMVSAREIKESDWLDKHRDEYKFSIYSLSHDKLSQIDVKKELNTLYNEMISSFFPVQIDKLDPFSLLQYPERKHLKLKNGYLTLGEYGYLSYFELKSKSLKEHKQLYDQIHEIVNDDIDIKVFSPIFYYVENSNAIRADVNKIIWIAMGILLLLYVFILRDISLLLNTVMTLGTSAMLSIIFITQLYGEVSIFVFVFGVSISSIAIDYMFHHYLHGHYAQEKAFNKEVFFGFITTGSAFFILSFTSFLLIKQIAIFSMISLFISYMHFALIYPHIGFNVFRSKMPVLHKSMQFIKPKILLFISIAVIGLSSTWIDFDLNLKNLDYDNKNLKQIEAFFSQTLENRKSIAFAIQANTIDELIAYAQKLQDDVPSIQLSMSTLVSKSSYQKNNTLLASLDELRYTLKVEAREIGFKKGYFNDAYRGNKKMVSYTMEALKNNGFEILKINDTFITYGRVDEVLYPTVLKYHFTESLSLKERFEDSMESTMETLVKLGITALLVIILLIYLITKKAMGYSLLFIFFPIAMLSIYVYLTAVNILHIFMMFVILAIGIDYAIYLAKKSDTLTKEAISYSLISTFAGFGVLIFSQINALFSMGIVATIGILSVFFLLLFVKGTHNES
jgi:hypothetical protein